MTQIVREVLDLYKGSIYTFPLSKVQKLKHQLRKEAGIVDTWVKPYLPRPGKKEHCTKNELAGWVLEGAERALSARCEVPFQPRDRVICTRAAYAQYYPQEREADCVKLIPKSSSLYTIVQLFYRKGMWHCSLKENLPHSMLFDDVLFLADCFQKPGTP